MNGDIPGNERWKTVQYKSELVKVQWDVLEFKKIQWFSAVHIPALQTHFNTDG